MKSEEIALVRFLAQFGELKERRNGLPVVVNTTTGRKQQEPKEQPIKDPVSMNFCMFSFFFFSLNQFGELSQYPFSYWKVFSLSLTLYLVDWEVYPLLTTKAPI